jgi:hypothetical protein
MMKLLNLLAPDQVQEHKPSLAFSKSSGRTENDDERNDGCLEALVWIEGGSVSVRFAWLKITTT